MNTLGSGFSEYFMMRLNGLRHHEACSELGICNTVAQAYLQLYTYEVDTFNEQVRSKL